MKLLLDTHAYLWFLADDPCLSATARAAIMSLDNQIFASLASAWEIALKVKLKKLTFPSPLARSFEQGCAAGAFQMLPISLAHIEKTTELDFVHRDPFDRLLVAQALVKDLAVVSRDQVFEDYGVKRVW